MLSYPQRQYHQPPHPAGHLLILGHTQTLQTLEGSDLEHECMYAKCCHDICLIECFCRMLMGAPAAKRLEALWLVSPDSVCGHSGYWGLSCTSHPVVNAYPHSTRAVWVCAMPGNRQTFTNLALARNYSLSLLHN